MTDSLSIAVPAFFSCESMSVPDHGTNYRYGSNNSIKYYLFVYTSLNDQTAVFLKIQFSTSHSFSLSMNLKYFYLIL